jgi:creatine kinase
LLLVTCLVAANNGPRDPFVEVVQGDATKLATPAQENAGSNPSWDVNLKLDTNPAALDEEPLKIRVKDGNGASKDRVLGRGRVNPDDAVSGPGDWMDITGDLLDGDGKPAGEYHLKARYRPKSQIPANDDLPYPNFTSAHTSLMRKNLTPELFQDLKSCRTPGGVTLMQNIQGGVDCPGDVAGLTAGDADSYDTFSALFDPVIEAYQGVSLSDSECYVTNRDSSELERMETIDYAFVVSSHIRSKRNIAGTAFTPSISASQRLELESSLIDALQSMKGEFAGQYHTLQDISTEERDRLASCGLLLLPPVSGSGLDASGVSRQWPQGRGVFTNGSEEFAVWINGEDHLCVVSQNQGGDIASVFEDWTTAVNGVENCLMSNGKKFEESSRLGYLTTSPCDVGTGFHASMVVRLGGLGSDESKLRGLCDELGLVATSQASSGQADCWEIANKVTLGKTEVELVQQVIDGVASLIQSEKESESNSLTFPNFTSAHTSLMRKNLTPELFQDLKSCRTPGGVTLMQNIQGGVDCPGDVAGLTAGDADSYDTFSALFDPVIEAYQGVSLSDSECYVTNRDSSELERMETIDYAFVVSSHIRSKRNIAGTAFTPSISASQRLELESSLIDALQSMKGEFAGQYHTLQDISTEERDRLASCGLLLLPPVSGSGLDASGVSRQWPQGRGVFTNGSEEFAVWINGEDHLCVVSQNQGGDIASVFEDWTTAVNGVENCLMSNGKKFEESSRLGYLTTSPCDVGTGFHASMVVRLGGLGSDESKLRGLCDELGLVATSQASSGQADCWEIANKVTLGKTEVELVQQVIDGVAVISNQQWE